MSTDDERAVVRRFQEAREQAEWQTDVQPDGTAVTSLFCEWMGEPCEGCAHTFREGDRVRVERDDDGSLMSVRHLDPLLGCAGTSTAAARTSELVERFHAAMDAAHKPPEGLRLERLLPGDVLLEASELRPSCPQCSYTFRPFEVVVRCPCREPNCNVSLHRDVERGLTCFDDRWPDHRVNHCLFRKRALEAR
ncbi:hypothetical protein ACQP2E_20815 [Actinoplanes sp. CA-015351]|uniref:hypothetical protein n=1 Tax=Actinoplanes sp. CA-015351 TaxID=3239897 RepID=UPI003D97AF86